MTAGARNVTATALGRPLADPEGHGQGEGRGRGPEPVPGQPGSRRRSGPTRAHTFTVTAQDAYGNTVTNYHGHGPVHQFRRAGRAAGPYTFTAAEQGQARFTAKFADARDRPVAGGDGRGRRERHRVGDGDHGDVTPLPAGVTPEGYATPPANRPGVSRGAAARIRRVYRQPAPANSPAPPANRPSAPYNLPSPPPVPTETAPRGRHRDSRPPQALRPGRGLAGRHPQGRARRDLRPARPERGRQDHPHQDPARHRQARRGRGHPVPPPGRHRRRPQAGRLPARGPPVPRVPLGLQPARLLRHPLRHAQGRPARRRSPSCSTRSGWPAGCTTRSAPTPRA